MTTVVRATGDKTIGARATVDKAIRVKKIADKVTAGRGIVDRTKSELSLDPREDVHPEPKSIDVTIDAVLTTSDGHSFKVVVRDLSASGFRLDLDDEVLVGEHISLQVGSRSTFRGEIKWALGKEAGGHFFEKSDSDSE